MLSINVKAFNFNETATHVLNTTKEISANTTPLTQTALVTITGFLPRDHSLNFEGLVSDVGVVEQNRGESIRATQGTDAAT
jgi:hypothetical protein